MADIGSKVKKAWMKGMEAIGNTAGNIANNTKYKVSEMNLVNRRREILTDFGARAYELWQKGENFPEELAKQLQELHDLDIELNNMRAERLAGVKTKEEGEAAEAKKESSVSDAEPVSEADALKGDVPELEMPEEKKEDAPFTPLSDAIDKLVNGVDETAESVKDASEKSGISEKAGQALDALGSTLKSMSDAVGSAISSMASTLAGQKETTGREKKKEEPVQTEAPAAKAGAAEERTSFALAFDMPSPEAPNADACFSSAEESQNDAFCTYGSSEENAHPASGDASLQEGSTWKNTDNPAERNEEAHD